MRVWRVLINLLPGSKVFNIFGLSGWDQRGDEGICCWLGEDDIIILWIRLRGVVSFLLDSVAGRSRRHGLVHSNLGKIQVRIEGLNLPKAIFKPYTIISTTRIYERLRGLVFIYGISLSRLHLLKEGYQLFLYFLLGFLLALPLTTLLFLLALQMFHPLFKRMDGILIFFFFICQELYTLMQAGYHAFLGDTPYLAKLSSAPTPTKQSNRRLLNK